MNKVYIVTPVEYSGYHIEACFTTKEKAEEYIENYKNSDEFSWWKDALEIEEYDLDISSEIVNVMSTCIEFKSPFSKREYKENISGISIEKQLKYNVFKYGKINIWCFDYSNLTVRMIMNPNKTEEEEKERIKKIAYDTITRIKYLYEVENVKNIVEMNRRLQEC